MLAIIVAATMLDLVETRCRETGVTVRENGSSSYSGAIASPPDCRGVRWENVNDCAGCASAEIVVSTRGSVTGPDLAVVRRELKAAAAASGNPRDAVAVRHWDRESTSVDWIAGAPVEQRVSLSPRKCQTRDGTWCGLLFFGATLGPSSVLSPGVEVRDLLLDPALRRVTGLVVHDVKRKRWAILDEFASTPFGRVGVNAISPRYLLVFGGNRYELRWSRLDLETGAVDVVVSESGEAPEREPRVLGTKVALWRPAIVLSHERPGRGGFLVDLLDLSRREIPPEEEVAIAASLGDVQRLLELLQSGHEEVDAIVAALPRAEWAFVEGDDPFRPYPWVGLRTPEGVYTLWLRREGDPPDTLRPPDLGALRGRLLDEPDFREANSVRRWEETAALRRLATEIGDAGEGPGWNILDALYLLRNREDPAEIRDARQKLCAAKAALLRRHRATDFRDLVSALCQQDEPCQGWFECP